MISDMDGTFHHLLMTQTNLYNHDHQEIDH